MKFFTWNFIILFLFSGLVMAQMRPPVLVVKAGEKEEPVKLAELSVETRVLGHLAETRMEMAFYNPHNRVLAGDLYFPLPEGATVSGYALDIEGVMVDGVVVTKEKARQVFETEVRKGIDPGIVEWAKGNNFKTRVFPIPARGTRRVMVKYISELVENKGDLLYSLPLNFKTKLDKFSLKVTVIQSRQAPETRENPLVNFSFKKWEEAYVAEQSLKNVTLQKNLVLALPETAIPEPMIEKDSDGNIYFLVKDSPRAPEASAAAVQPSVVRVFWDASHSRAAADHKREFDILRDYLVSVGKKKIKVGIVVFRNTPSDPVVFQYQNGKGSFDKIESFLKYQACDGGTRMSSISVPAAGRDRINLLFSDGLSTFGKAVPGELKAPLYIFNTSSSADHSFLKYLAVESGGAYFNMNRLDNKAAISRIGRSQFSFLGARYDKGVVSDAYPRTRQAISGSFLFTGKIPSGKKGNQKLVLAFGINGEETSTRTVTLDLNSVPQGGLLKRYWAQKKIDDLMVFAEKNASEITALGKQYSIVTPGTSLIVLESLSQYLEHEIEPPASLPKMRADWNKAMQRKEQTARDQEKKNIENVLAQWKERVEWWEKTFEFPKKKPEIESKKRQSRRMEAMEAPMALESSSKTMPAESEDRAPEPKMEMKEKQKKDDGIVQDAPQQSAISIKKWDPDTPYLKALKKASQQEFTRVYISQKKVFGASPAFYLDCADFFRDKGDAAAALTILSTVAELELENPALLRVLGHRLAQLGELDYSILIFSEVKKLRDEEPQSWRDLALVFSLRGEKALKDYKSGKIKSLAGAKADFEQALGLLYQVVIRKWDRFEEIELIALMEINRILWLSKETGASLKDLDPRFIRNLDCDLRISMTWDADLTDMDLHVLEPSGQEADYSQNRTQIGGRVSRDFTQGYGPEEYTIRRAMPGKYVIKTNYFSSSAVQLTGAVTLQVDIFSNYGRVNENKKSITLRLTENKETFEVGSVDF